MFTDTNEWLCSVRVQRIGTPEALGMAALIVGLFAPVGLTAFAVGMDRFQRRMDGLGSRR